ncbi:MAG: SDR family NAD(P)-dependent oxidoreductase [Acidobacteria bacterium]|nr:SDR family NAD(P)-dependent oxidoreductase [Acidobacteriota bacterium]
MSRKKPLEDRVAVVAGASRGAGRGIALALGEAGATVYVAGRTTESGPPPSSGAPGTIEGTAREVGERGGKGIPVRTDFTEEASVAALFERVDKDSGRLDVLANAVYGAGDGVRTLDDAMGSWGKAFWEEREGAWTRLMSAGPGAYYLAARYAMPLLVKEKPGGKGARGLIVGITDGILPVDGEDADTTAAKGGDGGPLLWTLSHDVINRLNRAMAAETKKQKVAVVTLMPGFMRTERVLALVTTEKLKQQFRFDLSESTLYVGRAVAALAADSAAMKKSGRIHFVADLAEEYGFTDEDGRRVPRFKPF